MSLSELVFRVKGSSADPYEITFLKDGDSLTALCSCPAGQFGNFCKHRIAILEGDGTAIVSENTDQLPIVIDWLRGSDVGAALSEYRDAEKSRDQPKSVLIAARRKLARAMNS